jgi:hypothetical protein
VAGLLFAQDGQQTLIVQNKTERTLFVLVPSEQELSLESTFRQVPAGGLLPISDQGRVAGVAYERGSFDLLSFEFSASRLADLTRRSPQRVYLPVEERHLVADSRFIASDFDQIVGSPQIDNVYLEWVSREPALARARDRRPVATYVDLGEGRQQLPLDQSLLWQRGGTDLEWIKGAGSGGDLYLAASSYSVFSGESSLFLYLLDDSEQTVGTIELSPGRGNGFVFLWTPTELQPAVVGNLVGSEFFMEAQLWRNEIESRLGGSLLEFSADVATANSAAGPWEEFVLGRIHLSGLFAE